MTRMLLAALALACVVASYLMFVAGFTGVVPIWLAVTAALCLGYLAASATHRALDCDTPVALRFACAVLGAALMAFAAGPALADAVAGATLAPVIVSAPAAGIVTLPYGDWIVAFGQVVWPAIAAFLVLILNSVKRQLLPFASVFISDKMVETAVQKWVKYAENATDGVVAGRAYDVNLGSQVLATAVNRATDRANASALGKKLLEWAGGPEEAAAKIFRAMNLDGTGGVAILHDVQTDLRAARAVAPAASAPAKF